MTEFVGMFEKKKLKIKIFDKEYESDQSQRCTQKDRPAGYIAHRFPMQRMNREQKRHPPGLPAVIQ